MALRVPYWAIPLTGESNFIHKVKLGFNCCHPLFQSAPDSELLADFFSSKLEWMVIHKSLLPASIQKASTLGYILGASRWNRPRHYRFVPFFICDQGLQAMPLEAMAECYLLSKLAQSCFVANEVWTSGNNAKLAQL